MSQNEPTEALQKGMYNRGKAKVYNEKIRVTRSTRQQFDTQLEPVFDNIHYVKPSRVAALLHSDLVGAPKLMENAEVKNTASESMQELPAQELPTQDLPVKELPIKELPIKELPMKELPVKELPVKEPPVKELPMENELKSTMEETAIPFTIKPMLDEKAAVDTNVLDMPGDVVHENLDGQGSINSSIASDRQETNTSGEMNNSSELLMDSVMMSPTASSVSMDTTSVNSDSVERSPLSSPIGESII